MKTFKHLIVATFAAIGAMSCFQTADAQTKDYVEQEIMVVDFIPAGEDYYYTPRAKDNWFISFGAGTQTLFAEHKGKVQFSLALEFDFGKWFNPYWGLRMSALGGELRLRYPTEDDMVHYKDVVISADFMWNMTNLIGGYDPYRIVSVVPFVGIVGAFAYENPVSGQSFSMGAEGGIRLNFRLCSYADLYVEGRANIIADNFNGVMQSKQIESTMAILGGFVINFGGHKFNSYNPVQEQFVLDALNGEVNALRSSIDSCKNYKCPPCPKCPPPLPAKLIVEKSPVCNTDLTSAVRFSINSSKISQEEAVNVYNIAQWLKDNPTCSITVAGYADKDTGTPEYNLNLSRQRSEAVVDMLVNKYGINKDRIKSVAGGSAAQPYPDNNNWNRVVVFKEIPTPANNSKTDSK